MSTLRGNREILRVEDVSVTLGAGRRRGMSTGNRVLQRVNLTIEAGSWTAIVGPNGAGKTTLLRACGNLLDRRDDREGRIDLMGQSLDHWSGRALAQSVAWLGTAEIGADGDLSALSAWDVVALGRLPHQRWWPSTGALTTDDAAVVQDVMMQTHTWQFRDKPLLEMSSGERQRVHVARALAVRAPLVLMDEPLLNLDPPHQAEWIQLVRAMAAEGQTIISVLHELNAALYADNIVVLVKGRVTHAGRVDSPDTRAAITAAFSNRIQIRSLDNHWVALPRV